MTARKKVFKELSEGRGMNRNEEERALKARRFRFRELKISGIE